MKTIKKRILPLGKMSTGQMGKLCLTLGLIAGVNNLSAQIYNETTLTIESGMELTAQAGVNNTVTGYIDNAGTINSTGLWNNDAPSGGLNSAYGTVLFGDGDAITGTEPTKFYNIHERNPIGSGYNTVDVQTIPTPYAFEVYNEINTSSLMFKLNNQTISIKNGSPTAIVGSAFLTELDESNANALNNSTIDWEIGNNTGTFNVPFFVQEYKNNGALTANEIVPVNYNVTTAGDASGKVIFSSSPTTFANTPYIDVVSNTTIAGVNQSTSALNRYWLVDASAYTTQPIADITFSYEILNDVCEDVNCANLIDATTFAAYQWDNANTTWSSTYLPASINQVTHELTVANVANTTSWFMFANICSAITVNAGPDVTCGGPSTNFNALATGTSGTLTYTWSPIDSLSCVSCPNPTSTVNYTTPYTVTATDSYGCVATDVLTVNIDAQQMELCVVTVDPTSTFNQVVWEKPVSTLIDSFYVYWENGNNVFEKVGAVDYDELSEFIDNTSNANPNSSSHSYKISQFDFCGVEGVLSDYHKTMFLSVPGNANLLWNSYEGFTSSYQYVVYRDELGTDNFVAVQTLPSSTNAWTDPTPPADLTLAQYNVRINFVNGGHCISTVKANDYGSTRSNKQHGIAGGGGTDGIIELSDIITLDVYPNPNNGEFNLTVNSLIKQILDIEILDINGKIIEKQNIEVNGEKTINFELLDVEAGIYMLKVSTNSGVVVRRLIKE